MWWKHAGRRYGKTREMEEMEREAIEHGEHVHRYGRDGEQCISGYCLRELRVPTQGGNRPEPDK